MGHRLNHHCVFFLLPDRWWFNWYLFTRKRLKIFMSATLALSVASYRMYKQHNSNNVSSGIVWNNNNNNTFNLEAPFKTPKVKLVALSGCSPPCWNNQRFDVPGQLLTGCSDKIQGYNARSTRETDAKLLFWFFTSKKTAVKRHNSPTTFTTSVLFWVVL